MVVSYRQNPFPIIERKPVVAKTPPIRSRAAILFEMILDAAEDGKPCPTSNKIAEALGFSSTASTQRLMIELIESGLISVETYNSGRVVTILETGKKTAPPKNMKPHWRKRPK